MSAANSNNLHSNKVSGGGAVLKLYTSAAPYIMPALVLAIIAGIFLKFEAQYLALFSVVLVAQIFFYGLRKNDHLIRYQVYYHQLFGISYALITIICFLIDPNPGSAVTLLLVGSGVSFLLVNQRLTVIYVNVYHLLLAALVWQYPLIISANYFIYSLVFSLTGIFVSNWLSDLLETGKGLQISEKKYRSLFENSNHAIMLIKMEGDDLKINDLNESCTQLFGYSREELLQYTFGQLSTESDKKKEMIHNELRKLNNQDKLTNECVFKKENGNEFLAEVSFVYLNLDGEFVLQLIMKDISDQKRKEIELFETVQSFKNIVDNSPASILIFNDYQLVYKNSHAEKLFNELLNTQATSLFSIFPKQQKYLLTELISEANDNVSSYTEISLGPKGAEKRYSISMVNIVYNGKNSLFVMLIDITLQNEYNIQKIRAEVAEETNKKLFEEIRKHKETQLDLLENTSKLNALFESSSSLFILTIDRDLKISSFNTSFKRMMNSYLDVQVNIGDDFLKTFPIEDMAYGKLIKKFKRALRGESVEIISHFPSKKGEIWVESFISPVKVQDKPIKEIAFIAHNITEKVESERKVLDSEANNRATVSAIPDMLFKVNKQGYFTDFRLNDEGNALFEKFAYTTDLNGLHISEVFKDKATSRSFLNNIRKALKTGEIHTQNFDIPFIIGKTDKKLFYENRFSRVNNNEVIVIARDVTDKVEFETRLIESVREKEVLLKEVHHRVKNNLQVISSILNLQSSYVEDEKTLEIINESQNRIRSMSYIHESLYQTKDFSSIDFHDYITNLVQNLVHSYQLYSGKTQLKLDVDKVQLILDQAIPCGLILNELVSNSLKYAYPKGEGGEIQIEIKERDGKVSIRIEDFGVGLPEGFKIEESDSLGLGLVDTLVDQIDGELILKTDTGTKYLIIFEKQDL